MSEPEVTEADRRRAAGIVGSMSDQVLGRLLQRDIAAALAAERAKAREPFLALADEYERHAGLMRAEIDSGGPLNVVMRSQSFQDAAASIRRAAEETA